MMYIAHRGLKTNALENTKEAFIAAANDAFYQAIECDIHMTKDKMFVVNHDDTLKRVFNLDVKISDETFDTLDEKAQGRVLTLQSFLKICEKYQKKAIIEVKKVFELSDLMTFLDIIAMFKVDVAIISFNMTYLKYLRALTDLELHLLADTFNEEMFNEIVTFNIDLALHFSAIDEYLLKKLSNMKLKINAWTLRDAKDIDRMIKLGVDYITKD